MDQNLSSEAWDITGNGKNIFWMVPYIFRDDDSVTIDHRVKYVLVAIQVIFFPVLAIIALPVNTVTILVLSRGKCGLSRAVTYYLVAMAVADLLFLILDLILSKILIAYLPVEVVVWSFRMPVCNIHAVLLYSVTDSSVWFTVAFTFDRFIAICCQKLKRKYCTWKTAAVVLGAVAVISHLKDLYWYFSLFGYYSWIIAPFICLNRVHYLNLYIGMQIDLFYYFLNPVIPFELVLLMNCLTVRHVLLASRARRRLRSTGSGQSAKDPEMETRKKSLILLLVISGNFILLWAPFTVYSAWNRLYFTTSVRPPDSLRELGIILQLLSCCTNTDLYTVTQNKFRQQLKIVVKSPLALIVARKL
ncbi:probable G-protein coupled receptor 139 [Hypanus sabinus]|uniref:probable G-protein coupled receptor 139 n=1 Tax=Hypanus sabinus TaxID=79690 RepID=UPI0028C50128|nr:probable G-protein coupled receptor 139 [Hypanus sabinus]XP_059815753.1 probable G-protein coupled receptor 139 [Hypanus sabinus]